MTQQLCPAFPTAGNRPGPRAAARPLTCTVLLRVETSLPVKEGKDPGGPQSWGACSARKGPVALAWPFPVCVPRPSLTVTVQDVVFLSLAAWGEKVCAEVRASGQLSAPLLAACEAQGESFHFLEPQFPQLEKRES